MSGQVQRSLCAGMLALEAMVVFLTTPVMLTVTDVPTSTGLVIGIGLTIACVLAAGLMRSLVGFVLGWLVQVAAIALGFVVPVMFGLGAAFLALYAGAVFLGAKIDRERAEREAPTLPS